MFASRMDISVKEGKMVLSGCGAVNDCVDDARGRESKPV
jgi:hypothetical protein